MASSLPSISPELSLLIDACAPMPRDSASTHLDWSRVIHLARVHRVYPRVWARFGEAFPADHAVTMRALAAENSISALRNVARTIEVVRLLRDAGIESIVLKGPLLAHDLYGDIALRVAGDIDLLVQDAQFLEAAQVLARAGYRPEVPVTAEGLTRHRKRQHDLAFAHPDDDSRIELHGDIAQPHYGYRVDLAAWWRRRRERKLGGDSVWSLSPESAYLLTALHAAKHRWHRLDLVADMAAFGASHGIDVQSVHKEAANAWLLRHVLVGEEVAAWLFGQKPPKSGPAVEAVAQMIEAKDFGRWAGIRFDLELRERSSDRARYLWRRLLSAKLEL